MVRAGGTNRRSALVTLPVLLPITVVSGASFVLNTQPGQHYHYAAYYEHPVPQNFGVQNCRGANYVVNIHNRSSFTCARAWDRC